LVKVEDVTVTNAAALGTDGKDHGEFIVSDNLRIGALGKYDYTDNRSVGDHFDAIVGILWYGYDDYKVEPRDDDDFIGLDAGESGSSEGSSGESGSSEESSGEDDYAIYDIQEGNVTTDSMVTLNDVIVTAVFSKGFVVQEPDGGKYSGIYIYTNGNNGDVEQWKKVSIQGKYIEYFDLSEISVFPDGILSIEEGEILEPTIVAPADIATDGCCGEDWEGVLVKVENVEVINAEPLGTDGKDHGEFIVSDNLRIGAEGEYSYQDNRTVGDKFTSIAGIVWWSYDDFKLEPRDDADLVQEEIPATGIIISEIMFDPRVSDSGRNEPGKYIELYNASESDANLEDYTLGVGSPIVRQFIFTAEHTIPAQGYFVIGVSGDDAENGGYIPDAVFTGMKMDSKGDVIRLQDAEGTDVDLVQFLSGDSWPAFPEEGGYSMELINLSADNNDGANWDLAIKTFGMGDYGTPGAANGN